MKARVLIVDDDDALRRALCDRFRFWGHQVDEAPDAATALAIAEKNEYDLIVLDLSLPDRNGLEVLEALKTGGNAADVVVLTAHGSVDNAVTALKAGACDFVQKPADFDWLKSAVNRALERRRLERVNRVLTEQAVSADGSFRSDSAAMQPVIETALRAAKAKSTILVTGESGTGKQVMAEFIHRESPLKDGPFVYVNCVALSDELIESTLFGHEKGSFTGAVARKEGRLEAAAGGTAFLDEVGDVTPRLQTKLLHFLETGEFERVGGTKTLSIDCRIIAATNRDLAEEVKAGRFREDLYYRLNVIHLELPPLRERPEDVALLAGMFRDRFGAESGRRGLSFAARTMQIMKSYAWPGNVRQLKNAVERMVVLAAGDVLTPDLLPPEVFQGAASEDNDPTMKAAMKRFQRAHVARILARTGGNQTEAAKILDLQRTYLNRLIKELGLS